LRASWIFLVCCFASSSLGAQEIVPLPASESNSYYRTPDPIATENARERIKQRARSIPDKLYLATVVTREGLSIGDVGSFARSWNLEVARIEIKVPLSSGITQTISLGAMDLLSSNGTIEERLTRSIGRVRLKYARMAEELSGADAEKYQEDSEQFQELAYAEMRIYKLEVIGSASNIEKILADDRVATVFAEESTQRAAGFDYLKSLFHQANPNASWTNE